MAKLWRPIESRCSGQSYWHVLFSTKVAMFRSLFRAVPIRDTFDRKSRAIASRRRAIRLARGTQRRV